MADVRDRSGQYDPRDEVRQKQATECGNAPTPYPPTPLFGCMSGTPLGRASGIGWAIKQMYHGLKVRRCMWNGMGLWVAMQPPDAHSANTLPYIYVHTVQGERVPWTCSQTDLLAQDWEVATVDHHIE